jgi:hypothetical protein
VQIRLVRDRLQRCRGELSQITGIARDLERAEEENARMAQGRAGWGVGRGDTGAAPGGYAGQTFAPREARAADLLRRIQESADRCATILSEVERDIEHMDGGFAGTRYGAGYTGGGWDAAEPARTGYGTPTYGPAGVQGGGYGERPAERTWDRPGERSWEREPRYAGAGTYGPGRGAGGTWGSAAPAARPSWEREPAYAGRRDYGRPSWSTESRY